jgi:hypothetical protein
MARTKSSVDPRKAWHTRTMVGGGFIVLVSLVTLFDKSLTTAGILARIIGVVAGVIIFEIGRRKKD